MLPQSTGDIGLGEALAPGRRAQVSWVGTVNRRGDLFDAGVCVAGEEFDRSVEQCPDGQRIRTLSTARRLSER